MKRRWIRGVELVLLTAFFCVMLLRTPEPVMQFENTRIYKVFCIGDSITYGSGVEEEERETCSYPAVLDRLLGAHYTVTNYGISGKTMLDVPEKCYRDTEYAQKVKQEQPDILIIMLGTNDSKGTRFDAAAYKKAYLSFLDDMQAIDSNPLIYIMTPPEAFPGEDGEIIYGISNDIIQDEIRPLVKEIAAETNNVRAIDLYAVTENHPEYFADGIHPNKAGYEIVAQAIYDKMDKVQD